MQAKILFLVVIFLVLNSLYAQQWQVMHVDSTQYLTDVTFTTPYNGFAVGGETILNTTNGGQTWKQVPNNTFFTSVSSVGSTNNPDSNTVFFCGPTGAIVKFENGNFIPVFTASKPLNGITFPSATTGYAVGNDGLILKTTNSGQTWNQLPTPQTTDSYTNVEAKSPDTLTVTGMNGLVQQSVNGGTTWNVVSPPGNNEYMTSASYADGNIIWCGGTNGTLFKVTSNGTVSTNLNTSAGIMGISTPPGTNYGIAVGDSGTIFEYNPNNTTNQWTLMNSPTDAGLNSVCYTKVDTGKSVSSYNFWAVGAKGTILKLTKTITNVDNFTVPLNYFVSNNYPNPFNPSTTFNYSVPYLSNINIELYNNLRQLIKTVVNDIKEPGNYTETINAQNLASGIYFVKFNFSPLNGNKNNFNIIKKIVLIK